jgi:ABC-2 type transport system ATP-binding protein
MAETTATPIAGTDPLSVDKVSRWYGNVVAVNEISFGLTKGITGLLGPNGAGKSTLLHMLAGLLEPSSGSANVLGAPAWQNPDVYRHVGFVPEREAVYGFLSGFEFVRLSARLHGLDDPDAASLRAIEAVEMTEAKDRATGGYSKGMKQRIKIAAAIVHQPSILLLDEPFNGADPRQRLRMMDMLRRMAADGATIVFSSHILEEVERLAENVLVIVSGRLAASGDFHAIRRLMTDRPHSIMLRSSDDRRLAADLIGQPSVFGVEINNDRVMVRCSDLDAFAHVAPRVARDAAVTIFEMSPTDESLESVFSYLVQQ